MPEACAGEETDRVLRALHMFALFSTLLFEVRSTLAFFTSCRYSPGQKNAREGPQCSSGDYGRHEEPSRRAETATSNDE